MRLIDADLLSEELNSFSMRITGSANSMAIAVMEETKKSITKMIAEQPTAYDVDKVMDQIRKREVLFRGKKINGKWVAGCLLIDYVSGKYFIHADGNSVNESDKTQEEGCLKFFAYEVDPETVCQYTGLSDKNGRKIFEGDIVKRKLLNSFVIGEVVWLDTGVCGFYLKCKSICYPIGKDENSKKSECDEFIGNIFDNTELLKGDTNGKTDNM